MIKSPQIKSRITAVAKELANGKERADILAKYGKKWQIGNRTLDRYIENARNEAETLRTLAKKTANDTLIAETKEAVKSGLKTKTERLLILQNEVDACIKELTEVNEQEKSNLVPLSTFEKVALRKTIKELQSEISKIEGDYEKDNGQKKTTVNINNLSTATTEELLEYLNDSGDGN